MAVPVNVVLTRLTRRVSNDVLSTSKSEHTMLTTGGKPVKKDFAIKYLIYPQTVFVIGTYGENRRPNIATVALAGMCSQILPRFFVTFGNKAYTNQNIIRRKAFTVNVPTSTYLDATDYVGLTSGREVDKFAISGLTAADSDHVDAPYVEEFPIVAECELRETLEMGVQTMFIGEIINIKVDETICTADVSDLAPEVDGAPDMIKAGGIVYTVGTNGMSYYGLGEALGKARTLGRKLLNE